MGLHYWLRFEFAIWVELPYYLFTKKYWSMLVQSVVMTIGWIVGNYYLWNAVRPAICLWLFLLPQLILSMALMWDNFSQHIFVDPDHYKDDHRLTVNLLATPYNQLTFNDGYHIIHHKYPGMHWSEMPERFVTDRELDLHEKNDAGCACMVWILGTIGEESLCSVQSEASRDGYIASHCVFETSIDINSDGLILFLYQDFLLYVYFFVLLMR